MHRSDLDEDRLDLPSRIDAVWPVERWRTVPVVVAVSGGGDSMALLRSLIDLTGRTSPLTVENAGGLIVAHINHGRRGDASDRDEQFTRRFAQSHRLRFESARQTSDQDDEAGMAKFRHTCLSNIARRCGARYVALGHHRDDNVETMLHQLFRGTGPAGLCGMPMFRSDPGDDLVWARPMIGIDRRSIARFLSDRNQPFCDDHTNQQTRYTRNWIRHDLLPIIEQRFPDAAAKMQTTIASMQTWRSTIESLADDFLHRRAQFSPHRVTIDRRATDIAPGNDSAINSSTITDPAIIITALQHIWRTMGWPRQSMTSNHYDKLCLILAGDQPDRFDLPGGIEVMADLQQVTLWQRHPTTEIGPVADH